MSRRIGVTYDLRRDYLAQGYSLEQVSEFESDGTVAAIEETIRGLGYAVDMIGNGRALCKRLVAGERWDLVFNIREGLKGRCREAQVPALLEMYDIPYTFSDPLVCAATLDKAVTKRLVREAGLPTAKFAVARKAEDARSIRLQFPLFAKPLAEGTGKGIDSRSRIESQEQLESVCRALLKNYAQPVLVEEYLPGEEFTVAVIGNGPEARAIGTMMVEVTDGANKGVYSFDAKEYCESKVRYYPMPRGARRRKAETLAVEIYRVLECRDVARLDFRLDRRGRPAFLEVNPLPGLHPTHSDLPMIATQEGMSYPELLGAIISAAFARYAERRA